MRIAIQTALYKSSEDLPRLIAGLKEQSVTDWKFFAYENSCDQAEYARVEAILKESGIPYELYSTPLDSWDSQLQSFQFDWRHMEHP